MDSVKHYVNELCLKYNVKPDDPMAGAFEAIFLASLPKDASEHKQATDDMLTAAATLSERMSNIESASKLLNDSLQGLEVFRFRRGAYLIMMGAFVGTLTAATIATALYLQSATFQLRMAGAELAILQTGPTITVAIKSKKIRSASRNGSAAYLEIGK